MDPNPFLSYNQTPKKIVSMIRYQVFDTLYHVNNGNSVTKYKHLNKLEKLIESFHIFLCGNFFVEPFKENPDDFRLESEFIQQNMLGYFVFNLNKFNEKICQSYVKIFVHIITKYAYRTRKPFVEKLENRGRVLFERLLNFLATDSDVAFFAAIMLCQCCQQKCLAFKLIDLHGSESESSVPIYTKLFKIVIKLKDYNHLVQIFKVLKDLFLTHFEVAKYAFERDVHVLIECFNEIFQSADNYYTRLSTIDLFGQLIQDRNLQKLIQEYTTKLDNLKLLYCLMIKADQEQRKDEFIKLFEIIRLFILNPANENNQQIKQFFIDEYISLSQSIDKAQKARSYANIALFTPEYKDVLFRLNKITEKIDRNSSISSIDSDDCL